MHNDFDRADQATAQANTGLQQMLSKHDDYNNLVSMMREAFTGEGGEANIQWQTGFDQSVQRFFTSLQQLHSTLMDTVGANGSVYNRDKACAANFMTLPTR